MALIRCPDCGTDASDAAAACPKCGRPIAAPGTSQAVKAIALLLVVGAIFLVWRYDLDDAFEWIGQQEKKSGEK